MADSSQDQPTLSDENLYRSLFETNPLPMWIYDLDTLHFLAVNDSAIRRYGYTRSDFLSMTIHDLRPRDEVEKSARGSQGVVSMREWRGWRHRLKNGEVIEVEITSHGLGFGGHRAALVIIRELTDKGKTGEPNPGREEVFQRMFEETTLAMIIYDKESGRIIDANPSAALLYGYERDILRNMRMQDLSCGSPEEFATKMAEALSGSAKNKVTISQKLSGGLTREVEMQVSSIVSGGRDLVYSIVNEIAAAPVHATSTSEQELKSRKMLEMLADGYYRSSPEGAFLEANEAFAKMLGYSPKELTSEAGVNALYFEAPKPLMEEEVSEFISRPEVYRLKGKDGNEVWLEDYARYVRNGEGKIIYREGYCRDITHKKQTQQPLNRYELFFRDSSDIILFIRQADRLIVEANRAAELAHGFSHEELLEKTIYDLRAPETWGSVRNQMDTTDASGIIFETVHRRKDGSPFPVEVRLQALLAGGDGIVVIIARDCTERKQAESALRQNEEKYKSIFESSPLGILHFDRNGVVTECNESLASIMGTSRESILGLKLLELPSQDLADGIRNVLERKVRVYEGEYRSRTDAKNIRVRTFFSALPTSTGQVTEGIGIFEDITSSEKNEKELRESELRYRLSYEASPVPFVILDPQWTITEANPGFATLLGYSKEELVGKPFPEFLSPDYALVFGEKIQQVRSSGYVRDLEIEVMHQNGRRISVLVEAKAGLDHQGNFQQTQLVLFDTTERKHADAALRESEQKFRLLAESSSAAIFMYQNNKVGYVNRACSEMTGFPDDELLQMDFWEVVHPDFRELAKELGAARQRGESVPSHFEVKILTKSGDSRWVDYSASTTMYRGEFAVFGTAYDITERKNAKRKLEESEERHRLLVDKSPDAIMVLTDGKLVYLNPAALELLRADFSEMLLGKSMIEIVHPDSRSKVTNGINEIRKTLRPMELHNEKFIRLDGSGFDVDIVSAPITYLGKPSIQVVARDITNRRFVQEQLRLQSAALNTAANAIVVTDRNGTIVWANPAFESLTGYSTSEAIGKEVSELIKSGKHDKKFYKYLWDTILSGKIWHGELVNRRKDGTTYTEEMTIAPVQDEKGTISHFVAVKQDITMRKSLEDQLLQAQKLEGIGQLAGGVAHDYNNILGVILGYAELLRRKLNDQDPARMPVEAILTATKRGADLTKQLLAFAQKGAISPKVVDVNSAIDGVRGMLHRIVGENLKLDFLPGRDVWNVKVDPTQLDQMLVNLATNARDAITGGTGNITITTSNVVADETFVHNNIGFVPGEYVLITFADTGQGMDAAMLKKIFEPFFTTKPKGVSAGLGLATVYGIVKRANGVITVTSAPDAGTTFYVYLPRHSEPASKPVEQFVSDESLKGNATVLLVEDQADLLQLVKTSLEEYGYKVMTALGPEEALTFCEAYGDKIHLLLTDVIMPGMSGKELGEKISKLRPGIKTIFMSGYTENVLAPEGVLGEGVEFLQKPFTAYELAKKIHKLLNQ